MFSPFTGQKVHVEKPSFVSRASAPSLASIESFVTIALFSGIGLLLSLGVLIPDQYIPGEWFLNLSAKTRRANRRALGKDLFIRDRCRR